MDLSTTYLGLALKNPIVASASPLSKKIEKTVDDVVRPTRGPHNGLALRVGEGLGAQVEVVEGQVGAVRQQRE